MSGSAAGPPTIGLAGGIGAGKSRVAALLAELGCVVSDSDADARAVVRQERESGRERVEGGVKRFSRERGQTYLNS